MQTFDGYIKASKLAPYSANAGHWRNIVVRVGSNDEALVMIVLHPRELSSDEVNGVKSDLVDFFENREGKDCGVVSMYLKLYSLSVDK